MNVSQPKDRENERLFHADTQEKSRTKAQVIIADVIYPNLPFNRFIWAATNGEYYVVHYEHGGFLASTHVLIAVLKQDDASPKIIWRGTGPWLKNYEAFLTALQDNKIYEDTVE